MLVITENVFEKQPNAWYWIKASSCNTSQTKNNTF